MFSMLASFLKMLLPGKNNHMDIINIENKPPRAYTCFDIFCVENWLKTAFLTEILDSAYDCNRELVGYGWYIFLECVHPNKASKLNTELNHRRLPGGCRINVRVFLVQKFVFFLIFLLGGRGAYSKERHFAGGYLHHYLDMRN